MSDSTELGRGVSAHVKREVFLEALRQVCYLAPEREQMVLRRMQDSDDFYTATCRDASAFLEVVIQRHQEKHASLNICNYGDMRTGKSYASLMIASTFDPTFTVEHVVFDLAQMQLLLPHTTPGSFYIIDDVRERYGLGSKSEVVNTQTFLETAAKSGTCILFNSPTIKFTIGVKYFLEFLGYCDAFSLAILYAKAIIFKADKQVETLQPVGFLKFPKPGAHLHALLTGYEALKDRFIAEIRKKSGGSGTNIIDARIDYIMSEVDFHDCTELQEYQDEIVLWDHTLPSNLVGAMARKIRRLRRVHPLPTASDATPKFEAGDLTQIEYLRLLHRECLAIAFRPTRKQWQRDAEYASLYLVPESANITYGDCVSLYKMEIGAPMLRQIISAANKSVPEVARGALGEGYVREVLTHLLPNTQRNSLTAVGGPGAPDLIFDAGHGPVHLNVKLLWTLEDGLRLDATPESHLPTPTSAAQASFVNKFGVVVRSRAHEVRVIPLEYEAPTFSMSLKHSRGGLEWLAGYLSEHFGGPDDS